MSTFTYFGTDGIRGIYGKFPITESFAYALGVSIVEFHSLAAKSASTCHVLTCVDGRASGSALEDALNQGIAHKNGTTQSLGLASTPAAALLCPLLDAHYAIVITASHNPYHHNGFKIFSHTGQKLSDAHQHTLESILASELKNPPNSPSTTASNTSKAAYTTHKPNVSLDLYKQRLRSYFLERRQNITYTQSRKPHIVIDCANGATSRFVPSLFTEIAEDIFTFHYIGTNPQGDNINRNCGATDLTSLQDAVTRKNAHLGIAFDGDGDRVTCVDENGEAIRGDVLIALLAIWLHKHHKLAKNSLVTTIMANSGIEQTLKQHDISLIRTAVGDKHLYRGMKEHGASFGGEPSGHLIFAPFHSTGDGLFAALNILLYIMCQNSCNFRWSTAKKAITLFPTKELSFYVPQKVPLSSMPHLQNTISKLEKQLALKGRIIWRYSGTEDKLRIFVESQDAQLTHKLAQQLKIASLEAIDKALKTP